MAFQVSPGVQVKEVDLTNVVPAVSSTTGAFAGSFQWGPVDEVITVSDSKGFNSVFGNPANTEAGSEDYFTAESFLKYGSSLRVVRLNSTGLLSANALGGSKLLKNNEQYIEDYRDGSQASTVGTFISKYAGALGNSLSVEVCASSNAYYNDAVTAVNSVSGDSAVDLAVGTTTVEVDGSNVFQIGDIVQFANHSQQYKVLTTPTAVTLTIETIGTPTKTGLTVAVPDGTTIDRYWKFHNLFDKAPGSSANAIKVGAVNDECHIVVLDEEGLLTGIPGEVLETYGFLSMASDAKDEQGRSNYYRDVLARGSDYVYWSGNATTTHTSATESRTLATVAGGTAFGQPLLPLQTGFSGGSDGRLGTAGQKTDAYTTHFGDAETIDISLVLVGSTRTDNGSGTEQDTIADHNTILNQLVLLCEDRKDCMLVASPRRSSLVNVALESTQVENVKTDFTNVTSSSYAVLDSGWVYQYDRFNDRYCWVPGNGHTAGIMARSDLLSDAWFSPAGFSRGQYLGITKLAFNPKKSSRDDLYRARINPIVTFAGQGTVLFGDKTALTSPSAFDRVNVRRLFIVLEKAIATAAKAQLFEYNDAFTRAQFRSAVEPFLRDVKNRRGLVDFSVVCDETNNTDSVIDRNEFVCSIFVKPAKSINFITLNFVAARSGIEFEEIYSAV
jgi:hypothetical protein